MTNARIVDANEENIINYAICGYKDKRNLGYKNKIEWLKREFKNGLKYKFLVTEDDKAVGGIEYTPGEYAYKPVNAKGYMFVNCIGIIKKEYKQKGYGKLLLDECVKEAELKDMSGVVVIARKGGWMPGIELFINNGFEVADKKKKDFILLVKRFNKDVDTPSFKDNSEELERYKKGIYIFKSYQCPYLEKSVNEMIELLKKEYNLKPEIIQITEAKDAQRMPAVFGTFCIIINGKVVTDNPISKTRLNNILKKELTEK